MSAKVEGTQINFSANKITVDGDEITNDSTQAVYVANDIVFYLVGQDITCTVAPAVILVKNSLGHSIQISFISVITQIQ